MKLVFKFIVFLTVICSLIIAIVFIGIGVNEIFLGIKAIFAGQIHTASVPGVKLFLALDVFLVAFLFLIFSMGFTQLFIPKSSKMDDMVERITPEWLTVKNFTPN